MVTSGQEHDITKAAELTSHVPKGHFVAADKGYDSSDFRLGLLNRKIEPVIPSRKNRNYKPPYDREKYFSRYNVERTFNRLKQYRAIATRYDKLAANYVSGVSLACAMISIGGKI